MDPDTVSYLMFVMMAICRNTDTLQSPKKKVSVTLNNSVKTKAGQNDKGPRKALEMLPKDTDRTTIWMEAVWMAWILDVT